MSISVPIPLDEGFLRRECPRCERQFKWHHGPTDARPDDAHDPPVYACPYCGATAPPSEWWTHEQLDFARDSLAGPVVRQISDELRRRNRGHRGPITVSVQHDEPEPPTALHEPSDMVIVEPPCHPWEPMKISEDWTEPVHCLICGQRFSLG